MARAKRRCLGCRRVVATAAGRRARSAFRARHKCRHGVWCVFGDPRALSAQRFAYGPDHFQSTCPGCREERRARELDKIDKWAREHELETAAATPDARRRSRKKRIRRAGRKASARTGGVINQKQKKKEPTMATDVQRMKIRVPLGDSEHKDEEKGSTKIVRRAVHDLKGKAGKRTGIVNWRGNYFHVTEDADGFMECGKRAKAPETARAPMGTSNGNGNGAAKKATARKKAPAKKGGKRSRSAAKSGSRARARKAS